MARQQQRKRTRRRRKICRHSPSCGRLLSYSSRMRHYQIAKIDRVLPSMTPSSRSQSSRASDSSENHSESSRDTVGRSRRNDDTGLEALLDANDSLSSCSNDSESTIRSEGESLSDNGFDDESESGSDDASEYDAVEDDLDDLYERLQGMASLSNNAESWRLRNNVLTDKDRDNIRAFNLIMHGNVTRRTLNQMRHAFQHKMQLDSEYKINKRVRLLADIDAEKIDCCVKYCVAFTGRYQILENCPFCDQPRFTSHRKARRTFKYIPLIPRIQAFFQNPRMIECMQYRAHFDHDPDRIADVFDCQHYRTLLNRKVTVDGVERPYKYFSESRDIALGLSVDGYLLFKHRRSGPKTIPIILLNYNLPPQIRTRLQNIICVGLVHQPKDLGSFLVPLDNELAKLARGVPTFDACREETFNAHAYMILEMGDIVCIEDLLGLRGHNGFSPCRSCQIKGVRIHSQGGKIYYVPLTTPDSEEQTRPSVDPRALPARTHDHFIRVQHLIDIQTTRQRREALAKQHGIRHPPLLHRVSSIDYAVSFPWEWMHLFCENVIPNLVSLWSGTFKGLDAGQEEYEIPKNIWEEIGQETANAVKDIPSSFSRVLYDIVKDRSTYTAEAWAFWFMYLAPTLLKDRFADQKYYDHFLLLVRIMKTTLKFEIRRAAIEELEDQIIRWVVLFEEYYYQYQEERLPVSLLTIHGLLHIANDIRNAGPCWATWTFWMERYCGMLQAGLHSRSKPTVNLDKRVQRIAYLSQLSNKYELEEELSTIDDRHSDDVKRGEKVFLGYPDQVLRTPCIAEYYPDAELRRRIVDYFRAILHKRRDAVEKHLPRVMEMWMRMRVRHNGDSIRTATWIRRHRKTLLTLRNNSYIRYEVAFEAGPEEPVVTVNYGVLERILVCKLNKKSVWGRFRGTTHLLAVITPWRTEGKDAALETVTFKRALAMIVTDIRNVRSVVGRVESRGGWGIVDRNIPALVRPTFEEDAPELLDSDLDN